MCEYFSCLLMKSGRVIWDPRSASHEDLIMLHGIKDDKTDTRRQFLRAEISPILNAGKEVTLTRDRKDWNLGFDECCSADLPNWFSKNREAMEEKCWQAWEKSVKVNLAIGDEKISVRNGYLMYAYGNSRVTAFDNSKVILRGNAVCDAHNNCVVLAHDYSKASLYGCATGNVTDHGMLELWDNAVGFKHGSASKIHAHSASMCRCLTDSRETELGLLKVDDEAVIIADPVSFIISDNIERKIKNAQPNIFQTVMLSEKGYINRNRKYYDMGEIP